VSEASKAVFNTLNDVAYRVIERGDPFKSGDGFVTDIVNPRSTVGVGFTETEAWKSVPIRHRGRSRLEICDATTARACITAMGRHTRDSEWVEMCRDAAEFGW
jgi:hypothetical protein